MSTQKNGAAKNGENMIEIDDVHKAFEGNRVLDGVTCQIPAGKISVVMGPSGTGKSVLLRHVVGLLFPDKGDVRVAGKSVPSLSEDQLLELRRNVGMLFQDGALFSSMTLYDNVAFPLRQHTKNSETEIKEIVMARLDEVGLKESVDKMPNELSGGMRKRAGFARALVLEPEILLFDEPDSGLDPVRTALLCELIKEIQQKYKSTGVVIRPRHQVLLQHCGSRHPAAWRQGGRPGLQGRDAALDKPLHATIHQGSHRRAARDGVDERRDRVGVPVSDPVGRGRRHRAGHRIVADRRRSHGIPAHGSARLGRWPVPGQ